MGKFTKGHVPWNKKKEELIDWRIVIVGIVCLTAIEIVCLLKGINGKFLATILMIIAGVIGWSAPQLKLK